MKKIITVEEHSQVDTFIDFMRSKSGHVLIVLVSCSVLTVLTTFLFADTLQGIRGWQLGGIVLGILFSISFELSVFWCAINGYKTASYLFAVFSIIIARATFAQMYQSPSLSFMYLATWIMSISPVLIVLIASHKLAQKYRYEEMAQTTFQVTNYHHQNDNHKDEAMLKK